MNLCHSKSHLCNHQSPVWLCMKTVYEGKKEVHWVQKYRILTSEEWYSSVCVCLRYVYLCLYVCLSVYVPMCVSVCMCLFLSVCLHDQYTYTYCVDQSRTWVSLFWCSVACFMRQALSGPECTQWLNWLMRELQGFAFLLPSAGSITTYGFTFTWVLDTTLRSLHLQDKPLKGWAVPQTQEMAF